MPPGLAAAPPPDRHSAVASSIIHGASVCFDRRALKWRTGHSTGPVGGGAALACRPAHGGWHAGRASVSRRRRRRRSWRTRPGGLERSRDGHAAGTSGHLWVDQGRRHTFLAGGDAFQQSLSGRISGMACVFFYGTDKYVNWLRSV